jgi:preprotein translocase subunit SecY
MLVIFRFMASIPLPGVNREGLQEFINNNALLGILNLFSGAASRISRSWRSGCTRTSRHDHHAM